MRWFTLRMQPRDQRGLTLIELMISVVLLTMVTGALSAAFVNAINVGQPTAQRVREANDAQVIAGLLTTDAAATGGTDPETAKQDDELGVFLGADAECQSAATEVPRGDAQVRFKWKDHEPGGDPILHDVAYGLEPTTHVLTRSSCIDGGARQTLQLGRSVESMDVTCDPGEHVCPPLPKTITLKITATNSPQNSPQGSPYTYELTAAVRPQGETPPSRPTEATRVPFMALGDGAGCVGQASALNIAASAKLKVRGDVVINDNAKNTDESPKCAASMTIDSNDQYRAGATSIYRGGNCLIIKENQDPQVCDLSPPARSFDAKFVVPPAGRPLPADANGECSPSGPNPSAGPAFTPGIYNTILNVPPDATFAEGDYILCDGIAFNGSAATASGAVTFYVKGGRAVIDGQIDRSPEAPGVLVWQPRENTRPLHIGGDSAVSLAGIYAPAAQVNLRGPGVLSADNMVALRFSVSAAANTEVGSPPEKPLELTAPADPPGMPSWTVNVPYPTQRVEAAGGSEVYRFSATDIPPGLTFDPFSGVLSGTPTTPGGYKINVQVRDTFGDVVTHIYPVTINPPPNITLPEDLPDWTINRDYPGTAMTGTNGTTPYTWSWTAPKLPPGLSLNAATGVITGTPTELGSYNGIVVTVTDVTGTSYSHPPYDITINPPPQITGPATIPHEWTAGQAYPDQTMQPVDGTQPYNWSASGLPLGMRIDADSGVISGTPQRAGTFAVTVTLRDLAGDADTVAYEIVVNPPPGIFDETVPNAEVGRPYTYGLTPENGTPPFTWSATDLPPVITIGPNNGVLSGTPNAEGTSQVTVTIRDRVGASRPKQFTFTVDPPPDINGPTTLVPWTQGRDYPKTQVTVTGGVAPFRWTATGLPNGMNIDPTTGVISGTPNNVGNFPVSVTVTDKWGGTDQEPFTLVINAPPNVTTTALPVAEETVPYNATAHAVAGTPPYTWTASGLPDGVEIDANTGVISGTPTVAGLFRVVLTVVDTAGAADSQFIDLNSTVAPSVASPPTLSNWTVGRPYPATPITPANGTAPYTFNAAGLPPGLVIDGATGVISGTPTQVGSYDATVSVTDSRNATMTQPYDNVVIANPPAINGPGNMPDGIDGAPYPGAQFTAAGGTAPRAFEATGLPNGLDIGGDSGAITGRPTQAGTFPITVTVTDAAGATDTMVSSVTILPGPTPLTIVPALGVRGTTFVTALAGTNFQPGATVSFAPAATGGGTDPPAVTNVVVQSAIAIALTFDTPNTAGAPGIYDVIVTNPDGGTGRLAGAFTVT